MLEDISIRWGVPIRLISENVILLKALIDSKNSDGLTPLQPGGRDPVGARSRGALQATTGKQDNLPLLSTS